MTHEATIVPGAWTRWQECANCGRRVGELEPVTTCPGCGGLLDVRFDAPPGSGKLLRAVFSDRVRTIGPAAAVSGVWRYAELVGSAAAADIVSFPEGNTPLLPAPSVAEWAGCDGLLLKHEGLNPTGSFKDRGMTVGVTQACRVGARAVACASTGNTSASLAAYAARAGLPAIVLIPAGRVALGKLTQTLSYGARTLAVRGDFDACLRLARQAADRLGIYLLNSVNPFRVEGQKTIVLELLHQLDWDPPDWIALPAGNLGNLAAFGKAIDEAVSIGLISRAPRLLAVQAEGASPFYRSYSEGFARRHVVEPDTVATAIRIGDPASYDRGIQAIRRTNGAVVAVSDEAIMEAQAAVGRAGVGSEPASAASVAGLRHAIENRLIGPGERLIAVLTGHVLKDPGALLAYHEDDGTPRAGRNAPTEIDPSLAALESQLSHALRSVR
jgi:threonine synthase